MVTNFTEFNDVILYKFAFLHTHEKLDLMVYTAKPQGQCFLGFFFHKV